MFHDEIVSLVVVLKAPVLSILLSVQWLWYIGLFFRIGLFIWTILIVSKVLFVWPGSPKGLHRDNEVLFEFGSLPTVLITEPSNDYEEDHSDCDSDGSTYHT
jgi:hypothetical protein